LHCASRAVGWHFQGCSWGPEKTGPSLGWFVTASRAARRAVRATTELRPSGSPLIRPTTVPPAPAEKALV
jgi:hypothetical protein